MTCKLPFLTEIFKSTYSPVETSLADKDFFFLSTDDDREQIVEPGSAVGFH